MRLAAQNLAAVKGVRILFSHLSYEAESGQFVVVKGPNGSGKTTLLRMIAGLSRPQAGEIVWSERDTPDDDAFLHYCGHQNGLKPAESPETHLRFWAGYTKAPREAVADAMNSSGLTRLKDLPTRVLSAGQKRRVALARLFVSPRPVWLLDEPAAALDSEGKAWLSSAIAEHTTSGGLVMAALHEGLDLTPSSVIDLGEAAR